MITRRQILGHGMAASTIALGVSLTSGAGNATQLNIPRVDQLLVDTRFPDALVFAQEFQVPKSHIIELSRDVLELWHDRLGPACAAAPHTFAGVTTERSFFLLRTLAADHRLRVQRADHKPASPLVCWVISPDPRRI